MVENLADALSSAKKRERAMFTIRAHLEGALPKLKLNPAVQLEHEFVNHG